MIVYKSTVWNSDISEIEVENMNENQVMEFIDCSVIVRRRFSDHSQYWETKQQAKDHLTNEINNKIRELAGRNFRLLKQLEKVKNY